MPLPRSGWAPRPRVMIYGCDVSQTTCPWNIKYANLLPAGSPFAPREALAGKEARTLAREVLAMDADAHRAAFRGSPMKRAKLPMLERNAAAVLGNVGTAEDLTVLEHARTHGEALVREHAGWALERIADRLHASVSRSPPLSQNADTHAEARR